MKDDQHQNKTLTPEEKAKFAALSREQTPPPALEEALIQKLKAKGLLKPGYSQSLWTLPRAAAAIAASVILFAAGFLIGQQRIGIPGSGDPAGGLFVLFLYDSEQQRQMDQTQFIKEYGNWIREVGESGRLAGGEKLKDDGKVLHEEQQQLRITDTTPGTKFGDLSGYFLIEAENYEEALEIAKTCPHLRYEGTIELREIDRL